MKKIFSYISKYVWIIVSVCCVIFFAVAVPVYSYREPDNVYEILERDGTWLSTDELIATTDDISVYPYVTRVYEYWTNDDKLDVRYVAKRYGYGYEMKYGVVEDETCEYNYYVECFVYSDIADKSLVKRFWNISVEEGDVLTLTYKHDLIYAVSSDGNGDLQRDDVWNHISYMTIMRITVKPGCDNIDFSTVVEGGDEIYE